MWSAGNHSVKKMQDITITQVEYTGHLSSEEHFNTNFLPYANTGTPPWNQNDENPFGNPTLKTIQAFKSFGVSCLRFPAGQSNEVFSQYGIIHNGDIPAFIREALQFAKDYGYTISMVVPVESLEAFGGVDVSELNAQISEFVRIISEDYPGIVEYYELGNEYWQGRGAGNTSREVEYGAAAAQTALAIKAGLIGTQEDPDIMIQASGSLAGNYENNLTLANHAIQNAFASVPGALDVIGGVVRNFYWLDRDDGPFHNTSGIFSEDRDLFNNLHGPQLSNWELWAGRELTQMVGEYNIANSLGAGEYSIDLGLHGATIILEHYSNLVAANIDVAFIWPILHNTRNSLIHPSENIQTIEIHDMEIITNNSRVAMLDILQQTISGYELVEMLWEGSNLIEVTAFEETTNTDAYTNRVVFLSSRSDNAQAFSIDLSAFITSYHSVTGLRITSNDIGDHHGDATVTALSQEIFDGDGSFWISLEAYEVVQISFDVLTTVVFDASSGLGIGNDVVVGSDGSDIVYSYGGNDTLDLSVAMTKHTPHMGMIVFLAEMEMTRFGGDREMILFSVTRAKMFCMAKMGMTIFTAASDQI